MRKIVDYNMICGQDPATLCDTVTDMINKGWQPLGGAAIRNDGLIVQTMVRYEYVQ